MSTLRLLLVVLLTAAALGASGSRSAILFAQTVTPARPPAAGGDAVIEALVTEVRALRAELAETARASLRLQLLVARLQLQEQRLMHLDSQRANVAARLATSEQERAAIAGAVKMFEAGNIPDAQRGDAPRVLENFKTTLEAHEASEARIRAEEAELANAISAEQARWSDFSARLDELERALAR